MIAELDLGGMQRARVWIGECPIARLEMEGLLRRTYPASDASAQDARVAIELKLPRGPMAMYGLLGAHFKPMPGEAQLAVAVGCTDATERGVFSSPLVAKPEIAREGLPKEFAEGVLEGVAEALTKAQAPGPGVLLFDCAASGDIGSSPVVYRILGNAVTRMLASGERDEGTLREILADVL